MKPILISSLLLLGLASCSPKEEEQEIDYENMVMADEEDEWSTGDRKNIAGDLPDPQELIILEKAGQKEDPSEAVR